MNKGCDSPLLCSEVAQTIGGILGSNVRVTLKVDMMSRIPKVQEGRNFCQMRREVEEDEVGEMTEMKKSKGREKWLRSRSEGWKRQMIDLVPFQECSLKSSCCGAMGSAPVAALQHRDTGSIPMPDTVG